MTYPPYKNPVPEIPKLGAKKVWKFRSEIIFMLPCCLCFSVVDPLNLEILDGAASGAMLCFIQDANQSLGISEICLEVDGLMVNVLI